MNLVKAAFALRPDRLSSAFINLAKISSGTFSVAHPGKLFVHVWLNNSI